MSSQEKRLLILGCSRRKRNDPEPLTAIERYDGPTFRVLRRFLKVNSCGMVDVYILSAEFGLIAGNTKIPDYDRLMTKMRSQELQAPARAKLQQILQERSHSSVLFCLSQKYLQVLGDRESLYKEDFKIEIATGTLGRKLSVLYKWLYGRVPQHFHSSPTVAPSGKANLKGVEIVLTEAEVMEIAHQALAQGNGKPANYQTWYVLVGDRRVSPKWLVSQLTGLPVSGFHSQTARRILHQLGIQIHSDL
ncbi:MAG: DUF6884 domain-containing protein [Cyanobacteria bacterium P01_E01_bin.42]